MKSSNLKPNVRNRLSFSIFVAKVRIKVIDKLFFISHEHVSQIKFVLSNIRIEDSKIESILISNF